jgi:hypothetical protein
MSGAPTYVAGLSLGPPQDFTALAVLERTERGDPLQPGRAAYHYALRHLERHPPGTPYPAVCSRLAGLFVAAPLAGSPLAVDYTGVGTSVLELLRRCRLRAGVRPVLVTAGQRAVLDGRGGWNLPRRELAGVVQMLLQSRRLRVAAALPEAAVLARELGSFQVKEAAGAEDTAVGPWREGPHDDLVLAAAAAAWLGERAIRPLALAL